MEISLENLYVYIGAYRVKENLNRWSFGGGRRGGGCKLCTLSISGLCCSRKKEQKRQPEMRLLSQATPSYKTITF